MWSELELGELASGCRWPLTGETDGSLPTVKPELCFHRAGAASQDLPIPTKSLPGSRRRIFRITSNASFPIGDSDGAGKPVDAGRA